MAGTEINLYGIGDVDLTALMNTVDMQRVTFQGLSLTNYDNTALPAIAAGSLVEVGGTLFKFSVEEAITGWGAIANDTPAYIKLVPAGATPDTVTAEFTDTAPTWSDTKQGWYGTVASANHRYIATLTRIDAATYANKHLYAGRRNTGVKIGSFTIDGNGTPAITGVGFRPSVVIFFCAIEAGGILQASWGFDDAINHYCIYRGSASGDFRQDLSDSIILYENAPNNQRGHITSMDADGFTLTHTEAGAVGVVRVIYLALP